MIGGGNCIIICELDPLDCVNAVKRTRRVRYCPLPRVHVNHSKSSATVGASFISSSRQRACTMSQHVVLKEQCNVVDLNDSAGRPINVSKRTATTNPNQPRSPVAAPMACFMTISPMSKPSRRLRLRVKLRTDKPTRTTMYFVIAVVAVIGPRQRTRSPSDARGRRCFSAFGCPSTSLMARRKESLQLGLVVYILLLLFSLLKPSHPLSASTKATSALFISDLRWRQGSAMETPSLTG